MTDKKFNYHVIFTGQQTEGTFKCMTEKQAKTFAEHVINNTKLNDTVIQIKRVTPEPMIPFEWASTTANTNLGEASFSLTGSLDPFDNSI